MTTALRFNNVSKKYQLGSGQTSLREFLSRSVAGVMGREKGNEAEENVLWSLRDVSFELAKGKALGLIGPNGAGKSTTLKLLARITRPTSGNIETFGRIASLIELGAGFHIDLTGRENIYLNAAILGMPLKKVNQLFDEIVSFAGLEKFIDTPLKRYSSGMYVRLGFAVAAHVEPDILLVDEVLAVGDSQFRQRCTERIEALQSMGTTIVFVSHNLYMVKSVCDQGIFLTNGRIHTYGDVVEAINAYERWHHEEQGINRAKANGHQKEPGSSAIDISSVELLTADGRTTDEFLWSDPVEIQIHYDAYQAVPNPNVVIHFVRADGVTSSMIRAADYGYEMETLEGRGTISVMVDPLQLTGGSYVVEVRILGNMDVPLCRGHSLQFQASGLGLSSRKRGGVFVPNVSKIGVAQAIQPEVGESHELAQ